MKPTPFLRTSCVLLAWLAAGCQRGSEETRVETHTSAPSAGTNAAPPASSSAPPPPAPSASAAAPPSEPPEPPFAADEVKAVVVWQKDEKAKGGFRSVWLEEVAGKPESKGERLGVIAVSSTSIWSLGSTTVKGCSQLARDKNGDPVVVNREPVRENPRFEMPELVRASDGKRIAPWKDGHGYPMRGTQCEPTLEQYTVRVVFEGGMGRFVMASVRTYEFHGGAHGMTGETFFTMDLDTGTAVDLSPPEQDKPVLTRTAATALEVEPEAVHAAGVVLLYGPLGEGLALYRFWAPSPYSAGNGGNSYTNDFVISSKNLPAEAKRYEKLPAWVVPALKGKSLNVFLVSPARAAALKQQFDAAY